MLWQLLLSTLVAEAYVKTVYGVWATINLLCVFRHFYHASAVYAVVVCLSVCLSQVGVYETAKHRIT